MGFMKKPKITVPTPPPPPPPAPQAPAWTGGAARRQIFDSKAALGGTFLTSGQAMPDSKPLGSTGKGKTMLGL